MHKIVSRSECCWVQLWIVERPYSGEVKHCGVMEKKKSRAKPFEQILPRSRSTFYFILRNAFDSTERRESVYLYAPMGASSSAPNDFGQGATTRASHWNQRVMGPMSFHGAKHHVGRCFSWKFDV
ncbi:hypothetical protein CEXT_331931 [Caerostris extrusa]|uniref:Uncharacterized protein n=1 Tax=Caerostris extrusa TaxID=172846 RepID=A0AAV4VQT9_CAEEX|nr:hypothetical protein CEXT_331931 [Caerostris extrusa]